MGAAPCTLLGMADSATKFVSQPTLQLPVCPCDSVLQSYTPWARFIRHMTFHMAAVPQLAMGHAPQTVQLLNCKCIPHASHVQHPGLARAHCDHGLPGAALPSAAHPGESPAHCKSLAPRSKSKPQRGLPDATWALAKLDLHEVGAVCAVLLASRTFRV